LIDANVIPTVINLLENDEYELKKEAGFVVSNMTSGGTKEQIMFLADNGAIPALMNLLNVCDARVIVVGMEGISNMLESTAMDELNRTLVLQALEECGAVLKIETMMVSYYQL
jgi:hypothetical protein